MRRLLSLLSSALLSASVCTAQQLPPYSVLGNSTGSTGAAQALALYGIDVVSFGADPTGTNDSTTAIQNAVNAAYNNITHAAGTPGVVFFPCGMFKINVSD
jgi:hypothetical protein